MLFIVPSTGGLKRKPLFSGFKDPNKKIRETRKLHSNHEKHFRTEK
jgi:hypothetical protein